MFFAYIWKHGPYHDTFWRTEGRAGLCGASDGIIPPEDSKLAMLVLMTSLSCMTVIATASAPHE